MENIKFNKDECLYASVCKYYGIEGECNAGCIRYIEMKHLLDHSRIPKAYQKPIPLFPEEQDFETFKQLAKIKEDISNFVKEGKNLYLFSDNTGNGKAQPLDSVALLDKGYTKFKDLKIGDRIYGEDGKLHNIIGIFPQGKKPTYKVTFTDGTSTLCSDEHLWEVQPRQGKKTKVLTLNEILKSGYKTKTKEGWMCRKYKIPMTQPIQWEKADLPIDGYTLGLLLGDGSLGKNKSPTFSNSEKDVVAKLQAGTSDFGLVLKERDYRQFRIVRKELEGEQFGSNPLNDILRELKLYGTKSTNKFIPEIYKTGSISQRLAVLQGLFDTDGFITPQQTVEYSTSSEQLAKDVKFIVESLGGTVTEYIGSPKYTYKGEVRKGQNSYRLNVKLPNNLIPVTSEKHLKKYTGKRQREPQRYIDNIEYVGEMESLCIKVDNPRELYLTNNFIVTHNTVWAIKILLSYFDKIWNGNGLEQRGLFISVPQFITGIKDNITLKDDKLIEDKELFKDIELLVLDDIGATGKTEYNMEQLFNIIDYRVISKKSTLYTSNIRPENLPTSVGKRLTSRILANAEILEIKGGDNRW